jgi:hypothetical protein
VQGKAALGLRRKEIYSLGKAWWHLHIGNVTQKLSCVALLGHFVLCRADAVER